MKNIKLLIGIVILFAAFGFTLVSASDSEVVAKNEAAPVVKIDGRFSENPAAFE